MTFKAHILIETQSALRFNDISSKTNSSFTKFCYLDTFDSAQGLISIFEVKE